MSIDLLFALIAFAAVSSVTPGPNNLMLMASGANFGVRRTLPHMFGISLGHAFMVALVGVGLIGLFDLYPISYTVMKTISVVYLIWLAWKIARAGQPKDATARPKPMSFFQAAAFQWVNPKAWFMALTAISVYAPERDISSVILVALTFAAVNLPSVSIWAILGQKIRVVLNSPTRLKTFNITMAVLLLFTLFPVIFG